MASTETRSIEQAIRNGLVTLSDPVPKYYGSRRLYAITITETATGLTTEKTFASQERALSWLGVVWVDTHAPRRPVGRPRKVAVVDQTGCDVLDDLPPDETLEANEQYPSAIYGGEYADREYNRSGQEVGPHPGGFRLKSVKEALQSHGFDPGQEIAKVLTERKPVVVKGADGVLAPVVMEETGEVIMEPVIDANTRLHTSLALTEFLQPKLKAIDHRIEEPPASVEALDKQIAALLARQRRELERAAGASATQLRNGESD